MARFVPGKVVRQFSVQGKNVVFRYPKKSDLHEILRHINSVIKERACIILQNRITMKEEKSWFEGTLKEIRKNSKIMVCVFVDGRYAGSSEITRRHPGGASHVGELGIAIGKDFRNMGIGSELIKTMENLAKRQMRMEIVKLSYFGENSRAKHVYEKLGYREIGRIHKGLKHYGKYCDQVLMVKVLR